MNKYIFFFFVLIPFPVFIFFLTVASPTYAQLSGCGEIDIGNPPANQQQPSQCVTGGFTNPFPGGWIPNRLDMGYDGTFTNQIVAPFSGTITYAGPFNGWNGSYGVQLEANTDVGLPTKSLYFTEGVYPLVKSGQKVSAGTPIVKAWPSPYGDAYATTPNGNGQIEWGVQEDLPSSDFNSKNWHQLDTYSTEIGNCTTKSQQMVLNFSQWAQQKLHIKAPSQTSHAGCP
jgi:hypothetical protein